MSENISPELAYNRSYYTGGRCEGCGKQIGENNRGREGRGAWEAHHRFPDRDVTFDNIRVVCTTVQYCHLDCCHQGAYQNWPLWSPCERVNRVR